MATNKYTEIMANNSTEELIKLFIGVNGKNSLVPESLEALKAELDKRELTEEQTRRLNSNNQQSVDSEIKQNEKEAGRYTALKTVVGLISILGYIVIAVGLIALIFLSSNEQAPFGFLALVISVVIALPLLAYSNLIYVFIDIEHNTRKTREAIKEMNR
jgi:hypothetical protein